MIKKTAALAMASALTFAVALQADTVAPVNPRSGIPNSVAKLSAGKSFTVAFLGGSITEMHGYAEQVVKMLRRRYPDTKIKVVRAGMSSTCSDTGAFRFQRDVLKKADKIDLLFVDFAVNDNQDGEFAPDHSVRGMEGIVRQAWSADPETDIVFLYCANESHLKNLENGVIPQEIAAHERVADHYVIPSICFASQVCSDIRSGKYDWKKFGGVHPAPFGADIYADMIVRFISDSKPGDKIESHALPTALDEKSFASGRSIAPNRAEYDDNWSFSVPDWSKIPGNRRKRYTNRKILHSSTPGAELNLDFTGTAIGFFTTAGIDAGIVRYSIDGAPFAEVDTFREKYSASLHYPYTVMLSSDLAPGTHHLKLVVSEKHNINSCGNAIRIYCFSAN